MKLNPLELDPSYRDWWSQFEPNTLNLLNGINSSRCYVPRYFMGPSGGNKPQNVQPPGTYVNWVMQIPPGSFIWGIFMDAGEFFPGTGATTGFVMQVTDKAIEHKWFSTPISSNFFTYGIVGQSPSRIPYLLPSPYPVLDPGIFLLEFWSTQPSGGASTNLELTVGAAVPMEAIQK